MKFKPHKYQELAINSGLEKRSIGYFLEMGLGKTIIALTVIEKELYDYFNVNKVLVITPAATVRLHTWTNEIQKWDHLTHLTYTTIEGTRKQRLKKLEEQTDIHIISTDLTAWLVDNKLYEQYDALIIDELSMFKSHDSQRFKKLKKIVKQFNKVIGLTGTPAPKGYENLFSQVYLLDNGERLGSYITHYRNRYFVPGRRNGNIIYEYKLRPKAKEEIDDAISDLCISMKSKDWLDMPDLIQNVVEFELEYFNEYKSLEKTMLIELEDKTIAATSKGVLINKMLQYTSGAMYKDDEVISISNRRLEVLESIVESTDKPLLVFYNFQHEKESIIKKFKAVELKTVEDQEAWNKGEIDMLVAHPASIGYGVNIQYGSNVIVWYGLNWSLELNQQANARLYRQGQNESVIIHYIVAKNTIDEDVMKSIQNKKITQDGLIEALKLRRK